MANKRMFSAAVLESDAFLDLPTKSRDLYIHLNMRADDDGFVSPRSIMRTIGCTMRDLKPLENSGFVISFQSGVLVITDWKENNTIKADRYKTTRYQEEFSTLGVNAKTKRYYVLSSGCSGNASEPEWQPNGNQMETQYSIEENRIVESRVEEDSKEKDKQQPTAPPAAVAPHKGALGGNAVLDSSKTTERDSETEAARQRFLNSIKRPAWPAADAAAPDVMKEDEE